MSPHTTSSDNWMPRENPGAEGNCTLLSLQKKSEASFPGHPISSDVHEIRSRGSDVSFLLLMLEQQFSAKHRSPTHCCGTF